MRSPLLHLQAFVIFGSLSLISCFGIAHADVVKVRVLTTNGKPVPDAQVFVVPGNSKRPVNQELQGTTDVDGTVSFDLPAAIDGATDYGSVAIKAADFAISGGKLAKAENEFRLESGKTVRGVVKDGEGKAVAGAHIVINSVTVGEWNDLDSQRTFSVPPSLQQLLIVESGADGTWSFPQTPVASYIGFSLHDDRYAIARTSANTLESENTRDLVAKPGCVVAGRVVDGVGRPVAGVRINISSDAASPNYAAGKTDGEGKYRISGLFPAAKYEVRSVNIDDFELVANQVLTIPGVAGMNNAPDFLMVPGKVVSGMVKDAATGKPILQAQVNISTYREGAFVTRSQAATDAQGEFSIPVLSGDLQISASAADYHQNGPGAYNEPIKVSLKETALPKTLISLSPLLPIQGIAVDSNGKPVPNAKFQFGDAYAKKTVETDAQGRWTVKGRDSGTVYIASGEKWRVMEPNQVKLPTEKPIRVVLKAMTFESVKGKVVDFKGNPIAGATVSLHHSDPKNLGPIVNGQPPKTTTDADGWYEFTQMPEGNQPSQVTATFDNFKAVSGPTYDDFKKGNGGWNATEIVMAGFAPPLQGKVLSATGELLANAYVVADKGSAGLVRTEADGTFTLEKLLEGTVIVTAFFGDESQSLKIEMPVVTPLELHLAPPKPLPAHDVQKAYEILQKVVKNADKKRSWTRDRAMRLIDSFDAELGRKMRGEAGQGDANQMTWEAEQMFDVMTKQPEKIEADSEKFLQQLQGLQRKPLSAYLKAGRGLGMAKTDPEKAQVLLAEAETILRGMTADEKESGQFETVMATSLTGALAAKLNRPTASAWCDLTMSLINRTGKPESRMREGLLEQALELAAHGGVENFEFYAEDISPKNQLIALSHAIENLAEVDLALAMELLTRFESVPESKKGEDEYDPRRDKAGAMSLAMLALVKELVKTDTAAAAKLARRIQNPQQSAEALVEVAKHSTGEERTKLFQEVYEKANQWGQAGMGFIAAQAYDVDKELGAKLFKQLVDAISSEQRQNPTAVFSEIPEVAFYLARYDRGTARRLIEGNYALQKAKVDPGTEYILNDAAMAMAAVDLDRTVEMLLASNKDQYEMLSTALLGVATYALASEEERREVQFNDYRGPNWRVKPPIKK